MVETARRAGATRQVRRLGRGDRRHLPRRGDVRAPGVRPPRRRVEDAEAGDAREGEPVMKSRREFLKNVAVGTAGRRRRPECQKLRPHPRRQRPRQLRHRRPARPGPGAPRVHPADDQQRGHPHLRRRHPRVRRVRGGDREGVRPGARPGEGRPEAPRVEGRRRHHDRHPGTLARADGADGAAGRQARLRREAVEPQPATRASCSSRRRRSTASSCSWATSSGRRPTPSRSSARSRRG